MLAPWTQAWADEAPRYAPPEGARFQSELRTTGGVAPLPITASTVGQRVTSSDGMTWETSSTYSREEGAGLDKLSAEGMRDYLRAISASRRVTHRAFLVTEATTPQFTPVARPDGSFVGSQAGHTIRFVLDCPWAEFQRFFPIGQASNLSLQCVRRSWLRDDAGPTERKVRLLIADDGPTAAHTDAGDVPVQRIRVTEVGENGSGAVVEQVLLFSERLGIVVQGDMTNWPGGTNNGTPIVTHYETRPVQ